MTTSRDGGGRGLCDPEEGAFQGGLMPLMPGVKASERDDSGSGTWVEGWGVKVREIPWHSGVLTDAAFGSGQARAGILSA